MTVSSAFLFVSSFPDSCSGWWCLFGLAFFFVFWVWVGGGDWFGLTLFLPGFFFFLLLVCGAGDLIHEWLVQHTHNTNQWCLRSFCLHKGVQRAGSGPNLRNRLPSYPHFCICEVKAPYLAVCVSGLMKFGHTVHSQLGQPVLLPLAQSPVGHIRTLIGKWTGKKGLDYVISIIKGVLKSVIKNL